MLETRGPSGGSSVEQDGARCPQSHDPGGGSVICRADVGRGRAHLFGEFAHQFSESDFFILP